VVGRSLRRRPDFPRPPPGGRETSSTTFSSPVTVVGRWGNAATLPYLYHARAAFRIVGAIVGAVELILGHQGSEMTEDYRVGDGTMAVATRHLGWRLVEALPQVRRVEVCGGVVGDSSLLAPGGGRPGIGNVHPSSEGHNVTSSLFDPIASTLRAGRFDGAELSPSHRGRRFRPVRRRSEVIDHPSEIIRSRNSQGAAAGAGLKYAAAA